MNTLRSSALFGFLLGLAAVASAASQPQRAGLHVGYVYPAGGQQGATFEAVIGGQLLGDVTRVYVSGGGVQAKIVDLVRPIAAKELNDLRIKLDELMCRRAVARNDTATLQNYRSLKNAKSAKPDPATLEKELAELKQKYAGATWTDDDEKMLQQIRRKMAGSVRKPANPAISEIVVLQMTIDAGAAVGQRELRLGTPSGVSNPLVFHVGQLPEFSARPSKQIAEQKSAVAKTAVLKSHKQDEVQTLTIPCVVNGQILPGAVDHYRFAARKGQRLVIAVAARELIPYIADAVPGWFQATLGLFDAQGKELAYVDDFRFHPDPVLHYEIPADGQYAIEIKDGIYRGREDFVYRITLGELPFVTSIFPLGGPAGRQTTVEAKGWNLPSDHLTMDDRNALPGIRGLQMQADRWVSNTVPFHVDTLPECREQEPNDATGQAQAVTLPMIVNGRIDRPDDVDVFRFEGRAGQEIVADVLARRLDSPLDSVLTLSDAAGKPIAYNDDFEDKGFGLTTHHADSYIRSTLPADGTYYLRLADMQHQGGPEFAYRLRISAPRPDFALRVVPSGFGERKLAAAAAMVYVLRKDGFAGEIALALKDAPPGATLGGGKVAAGENQARLTLTLPAAAEPQPVRLQLEGRATIAGQEVAHAVVPAEDMMQAFEYRHLVPAQELLAMTAPVTATSARAKIEILSDLPIKIPAGGTARVKLGAPATKMLSSFRFELTDAPPGISMQSASPAVVGVELVLHSDAAVAKPGLRGKLRVTAIQERSAKGKKSAAKAAKGEVHVAVPAITFEVVAP